MSSSKSAIEWTDATWNPTTGCTEVSEGCDNCYARTLAHGRLADVYGKRLPVVDTEANRADPFAVRLWPERMRQPGSWREPRMVFVNSMSDLFHVDIPEAFLREVFATMLAVDRHTYQVLTKRPGRALRFYLRNADLFRRGTIPGHIWMGTSVENQDARFRINQLRSIPATVRFLSCEPLLGPLDIREHLRSGSIHQVIVGGESGDGYRKMNVDHARDLRDQCVAAGAPFFFKQHGGRTPKAGGRLLDGREWSEYPHATVTA